MEKNEKMYKTGQTVPDSGVFETVTGRKMKYKNGELFQACPDTGKETDWKRCDV